MKEHYLRSILKSVTFRIIATAATMILVYVATGNLGMTLGIGVLDIVSKLLIYYFHERAWNTVKWGTQIENQGLLLTDGGDKKE